MPYAVEEIAHKSSIAIHILLSRVLSFFGISELAFFYSLI